MFTNKIKEIRSLNEKEWFNTRADATVVGPLAENMEDGNKTNYEEIKEGDVSQEVPGIHLEDFNIQKSS